MHQAPDFSAIDPKLLTLTGSSGLQLDPASGVYTNRDLDLSKITLVGFDMDYTLARYAKQPMEQLQYDLTIERLIHACGYPEDIRRLSYDPNLIIRGLVVDKKRGHLLKMDMHGHVWRAMHGLRQLSTSEIHQVYQNQKIRVGSQHFPSLDTLFAMPEACLYLNLIDYFQERLARSESIVPLTRKDNAQSGGLDCAKLFDDIRKSIDDIHSDGTLKSRITNNIPLYLHRDDDLALTLHKLRSVGKKLFLLTNSHWTYTHAVMDFLLTSRLPEYESWRSYFDIVIVAAQKPSFFTKSSPFLEVDPKSKTPDLATLAADETSFNRSTVYCGGNIVDFERMSGIRGEQILYVGDHIYGDILRSKKESLWRTCLVVEELMPEIEKSVRYARDIDTLSELDAQRMALDTEIGNRRSLLAHVDAAMVKTDLGLTQAHLDKLHHLARTLRREIDAAKKFLRELDTRIYQGKNELENRFHPYWGRLFQEQNELSRFGAQVTSYACVYTGKVSNLLQYSPMHVFRGSSELMCHDRVLEKTMLYRKARKP